MFKLYWLFGLVLLFFVFLFINSILTRKINKLESKGGKTKKQNILLYFLKGCDYLLSFILLIYFLVVVMTMVGLMALMVIIITS